MYKINYMGPITDDAKKLMGSNYKETKLEEADAVLIRSKNILDFDMPKNIQAIGRAGVGVNTIPIERYAKQGCVVFNAPGANANGVKEMTIMGMVFAQRDIVDSINWVDSIKDDDDLVERVEKQKGIYAGFELRGKTLGVIGLGAIGGLVANAGLDLGMKVKGYDPYISVSHAWGLSKRIKRVNTIQKLLKDCDIVTLHVPQKEDTYGMIDSKAIKSMKKGAALINFARGGLVIEDAIEEGLNSGKISKFITDFPTKRSVKMKNTIVIPHLGGSTIESENNCASMAVREVIDYLENGNITNSVNYPDVDAGVCQSAERIAINHLNQTSMINKFATILSDNGVNIARFYNNSKDDVAYSVFDLDNEISKEAVSDLEKIDGVLRLRVLKK